MAPQGGILDGNWRYPGRYYECRKDYKGPMRGQWCNAAYGRRFEVGFLQSVVISHTYIIAIHRHRWLTNYAFPLQRLTIGWPVDFTQGMCFPHVCAEQELNDLMHMTVDRDINEVSSADSDDERNLISSGTFLVNFDCPTVDTSWTVREILGLWVVFNCISFLCWLGEAFGIGVTFLFCFWYVIYVSKSKPGRTLFHLIRSHNSWPNEDQKSFKTSQWYFSIVLFSVHADLDLMHFLNRFEQFGLC